MAWQSDRPDTPVSALTVDRVRQLLAGEAREQLTDLIAEDSAGGHQLKRLEQIEKMILLHKNLVLTQVAALPRGAHRELRDPFEEKKRPWLF